MKLTVNVARNTCNYYNISFICILQSYISSWNEALDNFKKFKLIILKLCEFSGYQTKMVFKKSFKYLKNEKINLSKVILKLECLFYQNIYLLFHHILYRAILTQTNPKKGLIEKKTPLILIITLNTSLF